MSTPFSTRNLGVRMTKRSTSILALAVIAIASVASPQTASAQRLKLGTCRLPDWNEDVRCGTYEVYENRGAKTGRKIAIRVVVLPATGDHRVADPIFYFAGGPGAGAVDLATRQGPSFLAILRRTRDIVLIDQRGTGQSNELKCDLYGDRGDMAPFFAGAFPLDRLQTCRAELEKRADLTLYTTQIAMEDADEIRDALGYETINVLGGSYGSTAALAYLRAFPKRVRTATVLGVAPPDMKLPLPMSKGVDNALAKVYGDVAADATAHGDFPAPEADLAAALHRLEKPVQVDAANPFTGKRQTVTLTRNTFVDLLRIMLYEPQATRWLPLSLHRAASGDFGLFVTVGYQVFRGVEDLIARGMHLSVICAEDVPFITDAEVRTATAGTVYGSGRMEAYRAACAAWPQGKVEASFATPVKSTAPVLLVAGEADPVAPPWLAEAAARSLPNGRLVVVPHTGHSFEFGCVNDLIASFIETGSVQGLDPSCLSAIRRPPFMTEAMLAAALHPQTAPKPVAEGEQRWEGVLDVGAAKLELVLRITTAADGKQTATMDSPDQNAYGLTIDSITWKGDDLHFEMRLLSAVYEGTRSADGTQIKGRWQQGGREWPLVLSKVK